MATTIQISDKLRKTLEQRKLGGKESYENIIWDLLEDSLEISEETKAEIESAKTEVRKGKFKTLSQVKKSLGF